MISGNAAEPAGAPRLGPGRPDPVAPKPAGARQLAIIFALSGLLAFAGAAAPASTYRSVFVGIGVCDLLVAAAAWWMARRNAPPIAVLVLGAGAAFPVIAVAGRHDAMPASAVFVVLLFVWIGANFPPGTTWWLLPPAAATYLYAVRFEDLSPDEWLPPLLVMLVGCIVVAETVARSLSRLRTAEAAAQANAAQLHTLAEAAVTLNSLDAELVMDTAVGTLLRLGHDAAAIALVDPGSGSLRVTHAQGPIPDTYRDAVAFGGQGVVGRALRLDATVMETDYPSAPDAVPVVVEAGFRTMVASPVQAGGSTLGVLLCASKAAPSPTTTDPQAVELLAAHVGRALLNATDYAQQERDAAYHANQASIDALTGVGNRRHGETLLADLQPGDTVVVFDLDNFKQVNDTFGHAAGDDVLRQFARFLRSNVRYADGVARMGGEEFLVVVRPVDAEIGTPAPRLVEEWRAVEPMTTVSAGSAVHRSDRTPAQTLAVADAALFTAKREGRDRVVMASE